MLVRARRLVFSDRYTGMTFRTCSTDFGVYVISKAIGDELWSAKRNGNHLCSLKDSELEAMAVCQSDFDALWFNETEVMPLEWEQHPNIGRFKQSGIYRIAWSNPNEWQLLIDGYESSVHPTEELADSCANAHHRKIVLGE